ncbi:hypothetical protein N7488_004229 [Penicillium malachiteum]|nr:hypothetical protein N7488_004229 [Penicillium malachiteum]
MAQSISRTHRKPKGAPDYDSPEFWDARFAAGADVGEWLNSGEALIDAVVSDLESRPVITGRQPRVLHLGPGVSELGLKLRDACLKRDWMGNGIVNVDFSGEAVRLGQEFESQKAPSEAMHWYRADLLAWDHVSDLSRYAPFDVILDKSTSDAIATAIDHHFDSKDDTSTLCPVIKELLSTRDAISLSPVELLGLHLVPLTKKDTTWVVLSYSTFRFDSLPVLAEYWILRSRTPLKAPSGTVSSNAYTPDTFHWVYILDRK